MAKIPKGPPVAGAVVLRTTVSEPRLSGVIIAIIFSNILVVTIPSEMKKLKQARATNVYVQDITGTPM